MDSNRGSGEGEGAENSAEEVEEPERELGLAGARGLPRAEGRQGAGTALQVHLPETHEERKAYPEGSGLAAPAE